MKSYIAAALLTLCPPLRGEINNARMIKVLCQLEGGRIDDFGGPAHMIRGTWYDCTHLPYHLSRKLYCSQPVYAIHLDWISRNLTRTGHRITPHNVALVWRYGLEGAARRKFAGDYGERASNLYADFAKGDRP